MECHSKALPSRHRKDLVRSTITTMIMVIKLGERRLRNQYKSGFVNYINLEEY